MTKADLRALEQKTKAARKAALDADNEARDAKERARALAQEAQVLADELDLELWAAAQVSLGVDEEQIDRKARLVRDMPVGPTMDVYPGAG